MIRTCFAGALTAALFAPLPVSAQDTVPELEELRAQIEAYRDTVEAAEAGPFPEGSEGAAQATLRELEAQADALQAERDAVLQEEEAARTDIAALLPPLPQALPDPSPAPGTEGVAIAEPPTEEVRDVAEPEADAPEPKTIEVAEPDVPEPQVGALPALATLSAPLAEGERARRVLIRPDAVMTTEDGSQISLPPFSVHYVYHEAEQQDGTVLAIGRSTAAAEGWINAVKTEDWRTMLVMSYAPLTGRDRTVFFSSKDHVYDVLDAGEDAPDMIAGIRAQIAEGAHDPEQIVAIEPSLSVNAVERPYLMPVLDFEQTFSPAHGEVTILQLAALNRESSDARQAGTQPVGVNRITTEADARDFRVGVAFVIDTTRSMGPYIDRAKSFVREVSTGLDARGLGDRFDFALVGFRDNVEAARNVGYLRTVYRDFGAPDDADQLFSDVDRMAPAAATTRNWREDAFAGIDLAISDLAWDEVDTRLVFLITDASPRSVGDALASDPNMGPETIIAMASQRNISLFVMHMQTEEASAVSRSTEGYDDTERGARLYARLARTGDASISKYFRVGGRTAATFGQSLELIGANVIDQLAALSDEGRLDDPTVPSLSPELAALVGANTVTVDDADDTPLIAGAVAEEIFRYQTEYLGTRSGAEAPDFYRGWASDVDLANPERRALNVSVFMTRDQLSDLANRLEDIVARLNAKEVGMGDFFASVQAQSGQAAVDPEFGSFLPDYLNDLPYGSKFINLTPSLWDALGQRGQGELLDEVQAKIASYRRIYASQDGWLSLDREAVGDEVYPLPLRDLP